MKRFTVLIFAMLVALGAACLWDFDTLRVEAEGKMDIVRVLTGRFERWPERYYEMRLARVTDELQKGGLSLTEQLDRLDDAAVALDRLKRSDEAIAMIERKRGLLESADPKRVSQKDHWYRFYANAGTLYAHRWFARGANREDLEDIERGRDLIAKAIELNPDAHFGREDVQLMTMEWVIASKGEYSLGKHFSGFMKDRMTPERAQKGLVGLVMLGNAWESIDVFEAISVVSGQFNREGAIGELAIERVRELQKEGKKSLVDDPKKELWLNSLLRDPSRVHAEYKKLREDADLWAKERDAFVLKRLAEGKHPDTHPDFWQGYQERPPRPLDKDSLNDHVRRLDPYGVNRFLLVAGTAIVAVVVLIINRWRRRRALNRT